MMSYSFNTVAIHGGRSSDPVTGAVTTPIYQTTTFTQTELGGEPEYCYARTGNPTRDALEEDLAGIEDGEYALAFASGMAAANAVLHSLSSGTHVIASRDLYGGCHRIFTKIYSKFGVEFSFIDTTNPANIEAAITPSTKLLWLETPSNPLLRITDISCGSTLAKRHNIKVVVDNTFATPVFQRPLDLGADIVLHSTTKYIGGHSDVLGGALITNDPTIYEQLKFIQNTCGGVPSPQDCFLLQRGIKTLPLRVERHANNAQQISEYLKEHNQVSHVIYPGLTDHPQHELAKRQASGFGAIISIELLGGFNQACTFVQKLKLWPLAESLGGIKSLLCHPATMTHAALDHNERKVVGISDGLLRLSVGLEDVCDLINDLDGALYASAVASKHQVLA